MFDIMNILDSLLKQSSSAVVLAVTKIFVDLSSNRPDLQLEVLRRLKGPLLTLMAAATPELAYTVLVHIQALCMRGGDNIEVFGPEFKQFFCRYNEPSYIKNVKIDILTMLADIGSAEPIVAELSEYVTDVDVEISRRAIRAIGTIAVRIPSTAEMIVGSLTGLLELDIDYVSTEAAVVMKDLVRKYPQQFQRASGAVERCIKIVTEPEGKCAVLWILGEYGLLIEDAPYLLEPMIDSFLEEPNGAVRLEMLTAAVKMFFCRPPEVQHMLGRLLEKAIQETTHPDVRDRALLYYRLLEFSPEEARRVICAPKEVVEEFQEEMDADARDRIFEEFNTLSTVYKQPATKFVLSKAQTPSVMNKMQPPPAQAGEEAEHRGNNVAEQVSQSVPAPAPPPPPPVATADLLNTSDLLGEELDVLSGPSTTPAPLQTASDLLGGPSTTPAPPQPASDLLGMNDLLGGSTMLDSAPVVTEAPFSLVPGATTDGNHFQAQWARLPQLPQQIRQLRPTSAPLTTTVIEETLRQVGILVMASGTISPGNMKFYFYAKQGAGPPAASPVGGDIWFYTELLTTPDGTAQCSVKAENAQPSSVERFMALLWETLDPYIVR